MTAGAQSRPVRVLYVQYTNPALYPPLLHSIQLLAEAGCEVRLVGLDTMSRDLAVPYPEGVTERLLEAEAPGWRQKVSYGRFALAVRQEVRSFRPDWVYASDALSTPVAKLITRGGGPRLLYHEHDTPAEAADPEAASWFMQRVLSARHVVAKLAELCVFPNAARADTFRAATGRHDVTIVWNCPRRAEAAVVTDRTGRPGMRVLFHGSIVPARLPLSIIDALAMLPAEVQLVFAGYETIGHPGYVQAVLDHARACGIDRRVEYAGVLNRGRLLDLCSTCDVGLALLPPISDDLNEAHMAGASNKVFEYLARGLPVILSDSRDWREFEAAGVARTCQPYSAESIAAVLAELLRDADERRAIGERGRRRVLDEWNYEAQFAPILQRIAGPHGHERERAAG